MSADAYPGPWSTWVATSSCSREWLSVLSIFQSADLVKEIRDTHWQITQYGFESLQWDRALIEFQPFFQRRQLSVDKWATWELVDYLEEQKWLLLPHVPFLQFCGSFMFLCYSFAIT